MLDVAGPLYAFLLFQNIHQRELRTMVYQAYQRSELQLYL